MININGVEIDFDITSPSDMLRYKTAGEKLEALEFEFPKVKKNSPEFLDSYIDVLNAQLISFGNFIDEVFGDGTAKKLLGSNPSLAKVAEINDAIGAALEKQGRDFGLKIQKYKPNRAKR